MSDAAPKCPKKLVPDSRARERCGGVVASTFWRWDKNPPPDWPPPVVINGRKYRDEDRLDAFLASRVEAATA